MNRWVLSAAVLLTGCVAQTDAETEQIVLDMGTAEDYFDFLEYEQEEPREPVPFTAEPLFVSAIGKVRAQPDIAVLTTRISATNINESQATDEMGQVINAVQAALEGLDVETGFTAINSRRKFDELCLNENIFAWRRHRDIINDYNFNRSLDRQGDTKTKRRILKARVPERVCESQSIEVSTNMTLRVVPPEAAGEVLRVLSEAGTESARLYGYDFSDYDALYQEAASKAVKLAQEKAQTIARVAGATLGEIESFSVSRPERTGRFGPQPNVIRSANTYEGDDESVIERFLDEDGWGWKSKVRTSPAPSGGGGYSGYGDEDAIVVTATRRRVEKLSSPSPVSVEGLSESDIGFSVAETLVVTPRSVVQQSSAASGNTNALSISLLSGPQTITAAARLAYNYETPLDGKIIVDPDAERY